MELTKRDLRQQYIDSYLGFAWSVIQPLALMMILWFVFGIGLRGGRNMSVPFIVYLITGLVPYNFFREVIIKGTGVVKKYRFLIKKVNFNLGILPIIQVLSGIFTHFIGMVIVVVIILLNGVYPNWYWFQFIYYMFALCAFMTGVIWITSAISLFIPDIINIIIIVLQFLFYLTPIIWDASSFPDKYILILKINPAYYIVEGYRNSFINSVGFWEDPGYAGYFWGLTFVFALLGIVIFKRLKPHFADVV